MSFLGGSGFGSVGGFPTNPDGTIDFSLGNLLPNQANFPGAPGNAPSNSGTNIILPPQQVAQMIMDGTITDPNIIAQVIQGNAGVRDVLTQAAQTGANNFNPKNLPVWAKILASAVPAIAALISRIGGNPRPNSPTVVTPSSTPAVPGATTTPNATTTNPSAMPTAPAATDIAGRPISSSAILPGEVPPINPSLQTAWNQFLTSNVGQGIPKYPGQITAPTNSNLTNTWNAYNSDVTQTPGADFISQMLKSGALSNPAQVNPILAQMMKTGSPSGPSPLAPYASQNPGFLAPFLMQGLPGYQAPTIG